MDEERLLNTPSGLGREGEAGHRVGCSCDSCLGLVDYARCPACGDLIDFCQGHGSIGDPDGRAILDAHDADNHESCHPEACEDSLYNHEFDSDSDRCKCGSVEVFFEDGDLKYQIGYGCELSARVWRDESRAINGPSWRRS